MSEKRAHQRYSDDVKAAALCYVDTMGGNVKKAASELGIPRRTLHDWQQGKGVNEFVAKLRHKKKEALAEMLEGLAGLLIQSLALDLGVMTPRDKAITLGIVLDKANTLRESLTRHEDKPKKNLFLHINEQIEAAQKGSTRPPSPDLPPEMIPGAF